MDSKDAQEPVLPSVTELSPPHRPVRLILSDYDGTLTGHDAKFAHANVDGIRLAQRLGIGFGFATGRGRVSSLDALGPENIKALGYHGYPGVFCNGSLVFGAQGERVVEAFFPEATQSCIFDLLKEKCMLRFTVGLTESETCCEEINEWTLTCKREFREDDPVVLSPAEGGLYSRRFNKLMVWYHPDSIATLRTELEKEMSDAVTLTMPYPKLLEIASKTHSKGTGLHALARHLGIEADEILVMGDSENDISMFTEAGTAVAVGNATSIAKKAAMFQAVSSGDGALLQIVKTLEMKGLYQKLFTS